MVKYRVFLQEIGGDRTLWLTIHDLCITNVSVEAQLIAGPEFKVVHIGEYRS